MFKTNLPLSVVVLSIASTATAATIRVDPTSPTNGGGNLANWSNAYHDLQDALSNASSGDEIWVAAATYKPSVQTDSPDARSVTSCWSRE